MKKVLLVFSILLVALMGSAQVELGLKAGLSSYDLADDLISWHDAKADVKTEIIDANYGYHFGAYVRAKVLGFYVEPAILFNSNTVTYNLGSVDNNEVFSEIKNETYKNIDIPVLLGFKFLFLRVQAGPVAHIFLESSSDLTRVQGYSERLKDARYGYQLGAGLDVGRIRLDVNYENNLSAFGESLEIGGRSINLDDNAARIVASIGYKF